MTCGRWASSSSRCTSEQVKAAGRTSEHNALPFALPSVHRGRPPGRRRSVPADAKAADVGRSGYGLLGSAADPSREELGLNQHRIDGERSDVTLELEREVLVGRGARRPVQESGVLEGTAVGG